MSIQDTIAIAIALGCAFYVARSAWRAALGKRSQCGCDKPCVGSKQDLVSIPTPDSVAKSTAGNHLTHAGNSSDPPPDRSSHDRLQFLL
jgi:hypothetical protein